MTDSIGDLLKNKDFEEPQDVRIIKDFVRQRFDVDVTVALHPSQIIIGVKSSALAGALREHLHELQKLVASQKRLVIRII